MTLLVTEGETSALLFAAGFAWLYLGAMLDRVWPLSLDGCGMCQAARAGPGFAFVIAALLMSAEPLAAVMTGEPEGTKIDCVRYAKFIHGPVIGGWTLIRGEVCTGTGLIPFDEEDGTPEPQSAPKDGGSLDS